MTTTKELHPRMPVVLTWEQIERLRETLDVRSFVGAASSAVWTVSVMSSNGRHVVATGGSPREAFSESMLALAKATLRDVEFVQLVRRLVATAQQSDLRWQEPEVSLAERAAMAPESMTDEERARWAEERDE